MTDIGKQTSNDEIIVSDLKLAFHLISGNHLFILFQNGNYLLNLFHFESEIMETYNQIFLFIVV